MKPADPNLAVDEGELLNPRQATSPSVWSIQFKSEDLVCCETSGCPILLGVLPSLHNGVHGTYPDDTAIRGQQGWKVLVAVTGHFAFGA